MAYLKKLTITAAVAGSTLVSLIGASPASAETTHVVEPGDSLSVIARDYGVSSAELAAANGITNLHLIKVGQALKVPGADPVVHVVVAGETVSHIARTYGVPSAEIVRLNSLANADRIKVGQELSLPANADVGSSLARLAARYPSLPRSISNNPERLALIPSFERWGAHYGVAPDLLMAVAYQESGWQSSIVSNKGAVGIGQLLPTTAEWVANDLIGVSGLDSYNPDDNIRMSARFLLWLQGFHGDEQTALAGYYQGPNSVATRGPFPQTNVYVATISAVRLRFQPS